MKKTALLSCALAFLAACGDTTDPSTDPNDAKDACFTCQGKADGLGIAESSYDALAVLHVANTMPLRVLDEDVALDVRAARNIVETRSANGAFTTLAELDAVSYVGPYAARQLWVYADSQGLIGACGDGGLQPSLETCDDGNLSNGDGCSASCEAEAGAAVHGIVEGSAEAQMVLDVANTATYRTLDRVVRLDQRAASGIVSARPFATLAELDEAYYVGASTFDALLDYAMLGGQCTVGETDALAQAINDAPYRGYYTRSVRTDLGLDHILDSRNWPGWVTHGGCYGVDPAEVPSWVQVGPAESNTRLLALFKAYGESAQRAGSNVDVQPGLDELACTSESLEFVGCRFEFEPNPWSGITWNVIQSTDGSISYFFEGTWTE